MMDFYWHYSGKDAIDNAGKDNFSRAIMVAAQVFNSLTEYIQVHITRMDNLTIENSVMKVD